MAIASVTASLSAQNTFTNWISPTYKQNREGFLNGNIRGTWVGTVTLQSTFDDGVTVDDVDFWGANERFQVYDVEEGVKYRIGIKTGDYTSGTAIVRLSK
jgi:hypothetical protein